MPIHVPGKRDRHNRVAQGRDRNAVVMLSLTAMVDMFTVLVIFLLQNYNTTGQVIEVADSVTLPEANQIKEIQPGLVVVVSSDGILFDKSVVVSKSALDATTEMVLPSLLLRVQQAFRDAEGSVAALGAIRQALDQNRPEGQRREDKRKVTIQADRSVPYGLVRRVMFTVTEAGATEINFAVTQERKSGT
jgi:biopolymer transport protein ExbD